MTDNVNAIKINDNGLDIIRRMMFRLLPIQILVAVAGNVNGLVSSYFATNFVGMEAMSAVGLYNPFSLLIGAIATMLSGGCAIICGKYLGQNRFDKIQDVFSMALCITVGIGALITVMVAFLGAFDLTGMFTKDPQVRSIFNVYLMGQAIGVIPTMLATLLAPFLSIESYSKRTMKASLVFIVVNILLNFLFVQVMGKEAFGLALASSLGTWVFFGIEMQYFLSSRSHIKVFRGKAGLRDAGRIIAVGFPGAAGFIYLTFRGLILNELLDNYIGSAGISAFATTNNLLNIFWAVQAGMLTVSRLLMSISVGEEDRTTLVNIMKVMRSRFVPLMTAIDIVIMVFAVPLTRIFYKDASTEVFAMTAMGMRILPLCMPLEVVICHFSCSSQNLGRQGYVNALALLDGVVFVSAASALLIKPMGYNGVLAGNVLNGLLCVAFVWMYAWIRNRSISLRTEPLMVIPESFGVSDDDRIDITVRTEGEAVEVAQKVQDFCLGKGIDKKRAYYAALALEEMAVNIVEHGFTKDDKDHTIDVRVVHKDDDMILRIKDDCVPFDPKERSKVFDPDDPAKNIGIRMIYRIMEDIEYRNTLGLNVLTIRI